MRAVTEFIEFTIQPSCHSQHHSESRVYDEDDVYQLSFENIRHKPFKETEIIVTFSKQMKMK